jgi:type IV pilus assembly protein PilB
VLSQLRLDEKRLPQDGRFKIDNEGEKVSFRVSILPTYYGEKVVMRILREGGGHFTLESLGFHGVNLERVHDATKAATGIILVTGPTGSGKTTTLYTILELLNQPDVNISTIEDPIEYQMPRVNQTQVKPEIGFSFANGLRSLMRQDPDILMVGEIRDTETAQLAINAALTGHLVLSTLHTNSAAGAVPRLLDMGAEKFLLASTLRVVVGQRLVRTLCEDKDAYQLKEKEIDEVVRREHFDAALTALREEKIVPPKTTITDLTFYRAKKSAECEDGYSGRRGIHEVFKMTESLRSLMMTDATSDSLEEQARKEGMLTMLEDGIYKAANGVTSLEEVLRVISE